MKDVEWGTLPIENFDKNNKLIEGRIMNSRDIRGISLPNDID
jgi:hypothetical protein